MVGLSALRKHSEKSLAIGDIRPDEANVVSSVLEAKRRSLETVDYEARLMALENLK